MLNKNKPAENETTSTSRLVAFSDGVFSIAITLLVLELIEILQVKNNEGLIQLCIEHWQSFFAYIIGFITILICWINHHIALEYIKKADINFFWINGFLLFIVTITPFSTAVLAEYLEKESRIAFAVFGFNYILISIAADWICGYAYKNLIEEKYNNFFYAYKRIYRYGIFYTIIAFLLCFVSEVLPVILYLLLFIGFAAPKKLALVLDKFVKQRKKIN